MRDDAVLRRALPLDRGLGPCTLQKHSPGDSTSTGNIESLSACAFVRRRKVPIFVGFQLPFVGFPAPICGCCQPHLTQPGKWQRRVVGMITGPLCSKRHN